MSSNLSAKETPSTGFSIEMRDTLDAVAVFPPSVHIYPSRRGARQILFRVDKGIILVSGFLTHTSDCVELHRRDIQVLIDFSRISHFHEGFPNWIVCRSISESHIPDFPVNDHKNTFLLAFHPTLRSLHARSTCSRSGRRGRGGINSLCGGEW